jgi:hypothetical protein
MVHGKLIAVLNNHEVWLLPLCLNEGLPITAAQLYLPPAHISIRKLLQVAHGFRV